MSVIPRSIMRSAAWSVNPLILLQVLLFVRKMSITYKLTNHHLLNLLIDFFQRKKIGINVV